MSASNIVKLSDYASANAKTWPAEAFFITALIESGRYNPGRYSVSDHHFTAHKDVHAWCKEYQEHSGSAPTMDILRMKFPRFPVLPEAMSPEFAAQDMVTAWATKHLMGAMTKATNLLREDDLTQATGVLRAALTNATPALTKGTGVSDFTDIEQAQGVIKIPIGLPGSTIQQYTGGIGPGELWYVAARLGIGKTWDLVVKSVIAAENGMNVVIFSTEMPARSVKERIHRVALRDAQMGKFGFDGLTLREKREHMERWQSTAGRITIYDPSAGPCDATRIAAAAAPDTLIVVDYMGLMRTTAGARAIEDWRAAATISNELKETTLEYHVPILCAAQINREGQKSKNAGAEHLSQSDALGQDGDVIVTIKDYSTRVRLNSLVKNRHGMQGVRWFTRFEPAIAGFEDIASDKAYALSQVDEEAAAALIE